MKLFTEHVLLVLGLVSGTQSIWPNSSVVKGALEFVIPPWFKGKVDQHHEHHHENHYDYPYYHNHQPSTSFQPQPPPRVPSISTPEQCARACQEGEPPRTCYYTFNVEYYGTLTRACDLCRQSAESKVTADCQCLTGDGFERSGMITANRMYPGPAIMVCLNDNVVIDVVNKVHGNSITIHWHGIYQRRYPHYDGVPYVTQCPIAEGTTFRYQWKAENSGTHFWHAHTGLHKGEGLEGPLIVREPKRLEPNSNLWDVDNMDNVIFITDILHSSSADHFPGNLRRQTGQVPDNFLINGMGQFTDPVTGTITNSPLATFHVRPGGRYRFRLINACSMTCPVQLTIGGHKLVVIASDGEPFIPFVVDSITTFSAERYDFIISTNNAPGNYWIQVRGMGTCGARKLQQFGVLHYDSARGAPLRSPLTYDRGLQTGIVLNQLNVHCYGTVVDENVSCINNQLNARPVPRALLKEQPDVKLFLPFGFHNYPPQTIFQRGQYRKYLVAGDRQSAGMIGGISNVFPPSPLLSQRADIPESEICSVQDIQTKCRGQLPCECIHVEKIPLNAVVELILVDEAQIANLSHPFHLHGQPFYMCGEGDGGFHSYDRINMSIIQDLDRQGKLNRHPMYVPIQQGESADPDRPGMRAALLPAKDTFAVPNNGYTIVRFIAKNPGYWLFHCHFEFHALVGMAVVFQVGEPRDVPPVPYGFPRCGHFMPPLIFND